MKRYTTRRSGHSSENLIVVFVAGLAVVLFVAIVMWPSGSKAPVSLQAMSATPLGTELNDAATLQYLTVLQRVEPAASRRLHEAAETAITSGAGQDDLALLVLSALEDEIDDAPVTFFKADVKYFDQSLNVIKVGLSRLSSNSPRYCSASYYTALENGNPDEMLADLSGLFEYDSVGYQFALDLSKVVLEGVENGRKSPNRYGRLTEDDQQAVQGLAMRMMSNPKIANVMRIQTLPEAQQKRAMGLLNVCDISNEIIAGLLSLPQDTKKRAMGELSRTAKSDNMGQSLQDMAAGF